MRMTLALVFVAACGGSQDAPRPIADAPMMEEPEPSTNEMPPDDDGDGVPNEADLCPLAREDYNPTNPDGCPDTK